MLSGSGYTFSASYDSTVRFISVAACAISIGIAVAVQSAVLGCLFALIIALCYAFSPRGYVISEGSVFVKRLIGSVRIPLDAIRHVRAADSEDRRGCIRVFGNGGLFGYYGVYRTARLGTCNWYVTNRSNAVVLITDTRPIVALSDRLCQKDSKGHGRPDQRVGRIVIAAQDRAYRYAD